MATRALLGAALLAALLIPVAGTAGPQVAPRNTGEPSVSGRTVQGRTLRTTNGTWSGTTPLTFRYRWLRCDTTGGGPNGVNCATIPAATRRMYVLRFADVGHRIRSRVIASNADGTASANSNATPGVVQPSSTAGRPANTRPPTISGTPQEGQTLTANRGSWSGGQPQAYAYQWLRCDQRGDGKHVPAHERGCRAHAARARDGPELARLAIGDLDADGRRDEGGRAAWQHDLDQRCCAPEPADHRAGAVHPVDPALANCVHRALPGDGQPGPSGAGCARVRRRHSLREYDDAAGAGDRRRRLGDVRHPADLPIAALHT